MSTWSAQQVSILKLSFKEKSAKTSIDMLQDNDLLVASKQNIKFLIFMKNFISDY